MAKYDSVDRLMEQASEPVHSPQAELEAKTDSEPEPVRSAEAVLEAKVSAGEPPAPAAAIPQVPASGFSAADRGRLLLGALRPFLPAMGGALRLVDHGAAQAAARLLPLLGSIGGAPDLKAAGSASQSAAAETVGSKEMEAEQARLSQEIATHAAALAQHEEHLRKLRDGLSRIASEGNSFENSITKVRSRTQLLTVAVVVLALLVVAEGALLLYHWGGL